MTSRSPKPSRPSRRDRFLVFVADCQTASALFLGPGAAESFGRDYGTELAFAFATGLGPVEFARGYVDPSGAR